MSGNDQVKQVVIVVVDDVDVRNVLSGGLGHAAARHDASIVGR